MSQNHRNLPEPMPRAGGRGAAGGLPCWCGLALPPFALSTHTRNWKYSYAKIKIPVARRRRMHCREAGGPDGGAGGAPEAGCGGTAETWSVLPPSFGTGHTNHMQLAMNCVQGPSPVRKRLRFLMDAIAISALRRRGDSTLHQLHSPHTTHHLSYFSHQRA